MGKIIALTGATGAMGGEVLKSLLSSSENFKIKCILFEEEKHINKFVKKLLKQGGNRIEAFRGDISDYNDCVKLIDG